MARMTMLSFMAGSHFIESLDTQKLWGITVLDLKNEIFGKSILDLTQEEAMDAFSEIERRGMSVYCFSTELFYDDIEKGEAHFRERHLARIEHLLELARILKPAVIRLLAARSVNRDRVENINAYLADGYPWVYDVYREAIERIHRAGFQATIENECQACIFSQPEEILEFFERLGCGNRVFFTYDVQNLWEMGTYPSLEVYRKLAPVIGYLHLKGGQTGDAGSKLVWSSSLEDASWPVLEIASQAIKDGVSPVICLNPSHGRMKDGYSYEGMAKRDLDYLRNRVEGVE